MQSLWRLTSAPCCFADLRDGAVADLARKEEHLSDKGFAEVHSLKRLPVCNTFAFRMALVVFENTNILHACACASLTLGFASLACP